jgi:hypothetical protein
MPRTSLSRFFLCSGVDDFGFYLPVTFSSCVSLMDNRTSKKTNELTDKNGRLTA